MKREVREISSVGEGCGRRGAVNITIQKSEIRDFSKLQISGGVIHYRLYQQDGTMVSMATRDTYSARLFVSWVQIHDRHTQRTG